jgi:superfamily II DNA or RNA helicase
MKIKSLRFVQEKEEVFDLEVEENHNFFTRFGLTHNCHEVGATQYREYMQYFKARKVTGLTATPEREDGMTPVLKLYIGPIVEIDDLGELTTEVWLRRTKFAYSFTSKKDKYHELITGLIHNETRNAQIVDDVADLVMMGEQVAVYSSRIEHMEILRAMFQQRMPEVPTDILASECYGKKLGIDEQESVRDRLRKKEIMVLFGGKIIEQGFDCPPLSAIVLATPTKSRRLIEQVLGRAQREYLGKKRAILLDYMDEMTHVLKYQFFTKNRRIYRGYHKKWL